MGSGFVCEVRDPGGSSMLAGTLSVPRHCREILVQVLETLSSSFFLCQDDDPAGPRSPMQQSQ